MKKISHTPLKIHSPISKQCGFTLIELMLVMAIITILSTMGVMGYQGFIRGARDAQRMADIASLDAIMLDFRRSTGSYPTVAEFESVITAGNNGNMIVDPMNQKVFCLTDTNGSTADYCGYLYYTCDNGENYALSAKFETAYNAQKYTKISNESAWYFNTGHCTALDLPAPLSVPDPDQCRTKADCETDSVCVGPPPRHCRPKNLQTVGSECDENGDCQSNNCNINARKCKN